MTGPNSGWSATASSAAPQRRPGVSDTTAARCRARALLEDGDLLLGGGRGGRGADQSGERRTQLVEAAAAHRDGRDDRHAEFAREDRRVERQSVALGQVDHVERDHRRPAERDQLEREAQVVVEVGDVDHDDQRVGRALVAALAGDDVAGDALVGGGRVEAVGAGQVDQLDRATVVEREPARMALDGDARIIAHLLPRAGQRVEQRALAGIGVADERDQRREVHGLTARDLDGGGDGAADRDGHPPDAAGDRPRAEERAVQHLDADPFLEPELAQAPRLGRLQRSPVDRRHGRARLSGKGREAVESGRHAMHIARLRLIIN
jgi:hypothetical protein